MQLHDTPQTRALELSARIEGTTVDALLASTISDMANGRHIRYGSREPVTTEYLDYLESRAIEAEAARSTALVAEIGA